MLPYHTRFGPDWCFGLIEMKFKHSYILNKSENTTPELFAIYIQNYANQDYYAQILSNA